MREEKSLVNGLTVFLASSGRKVKPIIGDGNCLFRTLSDQLFNTQDEHLLVQTTLVRLENLKKTVFQNYLLSQVNTDTITSHTELMLRPHVWGTHMEVIAAASLFQIPVYFTKESESVDGEYHWQVIHPLPSEKLRYPKIVDHPPVEMATLTHFELAYTRGTHYDSIISIDTGKPCLQLPLLAERRIDMTNVVL